MNRIPSPWLLAGLLVLVLALFWLFRRPAGQGKPMLASPEPAPLPEVRTAPKAPDAPEGFGYKMAWFAVRTTNTAALLQALLLDQSQRCTWQQGVAGAYGHSVFVTPAVGDWTLVAGTSLPFLDSPAAVHEAEALLVALSRTFGEAQYFSSHRVAEAHGWMKAVDGQLVRAYAYVGDQGETVVATGMLTPAEPARLVNTRSRAAQKDANYLARPGLTTPDEDLLMHIAAQWSVDPTTLDERRDIAPDMGWLGHYKRK